MQMNRLFKIVYYLLENGRSTAPELAERFEVSIRTIYRDLDTISAAGIPIYATQGKGGGISLCFLGGLCRVFCAAHWGLPVSLMCSGNFICRLGLA